MVKSFLIQQVSQNYSRGKKLRIIVDLNSDGSKVSGELMFTGPCARLEGNKVFESLKKFQKEKNLKGEISEASIGYKKNTHIVQDEDAVSFSGTNVDSIAEAILSENKKRFPDEEIFVKVFHEENADTVVVSQEEISDEVEKDYHSKILVINEQEIKIDENLFKLIKELNEKGYKTLFCCSGHKTVHDGNLEIVNGKGYSSEKFRELFPEREHGEKTIMLRSIKPLISSGYIMFEYNDKNLELFERLEKECPSCRNGEVEFGVDNDQNVNFPFSLDRNIFSDEEVFYTEYEKSIKGKERLILRWNQCTTFKVLKNVKDCIQNFL